MTGKSVLERFKDGKPHKPSEINASLKACGGLMDRGFIKCIEDDKVDPTYQLVKKGK